MGRVDLISRSRGRDEGGRKGLSDISALALQARKVERQAKILQIGCVNSILLCALRQQILPPGLAVVGQVVAAMRLFTNRPRGEALFVACMEIDSFARSVLPRSHAIWS